ncbi:MAG: cobalamin-dependent protein [Ignavibacteria bacterium]|jgi:methanogenic corrinoid protein MtbC1
MISEAKYLHYLDSLLEGNKTGCIKIVNGLLEEDTPVIDIYNDIFQRSMYRVGRLWEKNRCTVAEEHSATQITKLCLDLVYTKISKTPKKSKTVLITCVDKEFHEIGPRMISDYFELNGWNSMFLGTNMPGKDVIEIINDKKPDVVGISNNFYMNFLRTLKLVDNIKENNPGQKIIIGGQALEKADINTLKKYNNVDVIKDLDDLQKYIFNN